MILGFEPCTACTLLGCSDSCAASVNTLVCFSDLTYDLKRYKASKIFTWSHLVAGFERRAPALRRLPVQPCRRRAGPPFRFRLLVGKLGFEARLGSCNVAKYSHPIEKYAAAREFKLASVQAVGTRVTPEP